MFTATAPCRASLARLQVEALLDRHGGEPPVMQYCCQQLIRLGYQSWAYRVVNSAGVVCEGGGCQVGLGWRLDYEATGA